MDLQQFFDKQWEIHWLNFVSNCKNNLNCFYGLNENVTMEMIDEHPEIQWNYNMLSANKNITMDYIETNMQKFQNGLANIGLNPNLTIEFLLKNLDKKEYFNWRPISSNKNITMEMIFGHPELPWDYCYVSANPNLTIETIKNNPDKEWDWCEISKNPNFTYETIIANSNIPWNWSYVARNKNITVDIINNNPLLQLSWLGICANPNLTIEMVNTWSLANNGFDLILSLVSLNENITIKNMFDNPDKPWVWRHTGYKKPTIHEIIKYPQINWKDGLSTNPFSIDKQLYISRQIKNTNLLQMHVFFNKNTDKVISPIEHAIFDNYLLKQILQY